jgi:hypothetical protein
MDFLSGFMTGCIVLVPTAMAGVVFYLWCKIVKTSSLIVSKQKVETE